MYAYLILISSLHLLLLPVHHAQLDRDISYVECNRSFSCGDDVKEIGYPFWGGDRPKDCGLKAFGLKCENGEKTMLQMGPNTNLRVLHINTSSHKIEMERIDDVLDDYCPLWDKINATFDITLFDYGESSEDLHMFFDCPPELHIPPVGGSISCEMGGKFKYNVFFGNETLQDQFPGLRMCLVKDVRVPVNRTVVEEFEKNEDMKLKELLSPRFIMLYKNGIDFGCFACEKSGGVCVPNSSAQLACLCPNGDLMLHTCSKGTSFFSIVLVF